MSIQTVLHELLTDKLILMEAFDSGYKIHSGNQSSYIEVHKNPDLSEINNIIKSCAYEEAKVGIDLNNDIYVWANNITHDVIEKSVGKEFTLRFNYANNGTILFMPEGMTNEIFRQYFNVKIVDRLKQIFPRIRTIEMISRPFTTVFEYKKD